MISTGSGGSRAVAVATVPPLWGEGSVHGLGKSDIGVGPGVSFEEGLHLRRGILDSVRVLVVQAVL